MSYRALIAAPTAELERSLTLRFDEMAEWEVVSAHRSSREVADTVGHLPALDVVLIHSGLGPLPVFDLIRDLSVHRPQLAIILVADEVSPETFTNAMEAGARGVLATDATLEELRTRVTNAAEWSRTLRHHLEAASLDVPVAGRRGTILTLSGGKGGVGTTTTAIHLAMTAAGTRRTVCLVDLDLQTGDLPGYLDLNHRRGIIDLVESGDDISAAMLSDTLFIHPSGPHILLAPPFGERSEEINERATRQILGTLRSRYDLTIVDCGAYTSDASAAAVELADTSVVALTPDLPALRGAQRLTALWERLRIRSKKDVTALMVRHSRKNEIQPEFARKLLGTAMLRTYVPAQFRAFEEAINTGDPARLTDDSLRKSYTKLVAELGLLGDDGAPSSKDGGRPTYAQAGGPSDGLQPEHPPDAAESQPAPASPPTQTGPAADAFISGSGGRARQSDRGAVMFEFAMVVPLLLLVLLLVWQVLLIGLTGMYASHAAAEGARQAAVTPGDHQRIAEEATKRVREPWDEEDTFSLSVADREDGRYVEVSIAMPVVLPGADGPWDITGESRVIPEGGG